MLIAQGLSAHSVCLSLTCTMHLLVLSVSYLCHRLDLHNSLQLELIPAQGETREAAPAETRTSIKAHLPHVREHTQSEHTSSHGKLSEQCVRWRWQ